MAEVVIKTSIFSLSNSSSGIHHHRQHGISVSPSKSAIFTREIGFPYSKLRSSALKSSSSSDLYGSRMVVERREATPMPMNNRGIANFPSAQMRIGIGKAQKWWEKGIQPNMKEVKDTQDLVDSLLNSGDKLLVLDFFSPGCGGCKALHPKICQLAGMNPDVQFLQVNYEEHKSMCYTLNVHVLPFFRFYRGAHGRLCSFSCTNATIKKFKDALAKHSPDRCGLGPPKGLEEKELLALAANKDLSFNYVPEPKEIVPVPTEEEIQLEPEPASHLNAEPPLPLPLRPLKTTTSESTYAIEDKTLVSSG